MPLYEYQCQSCGVRFERRQHMSDDPVSTCPECGGEVHRLIQPVGVIFRGSGFYVTDHSRARSCTAVPRDATKDAESPKEEKSAAAAPAEAKAEKPVPDTSKDS
jgi:putative FmdB family regulatory protein